VQQQAFIREIDVINRRARPKLGCKRDIKRKGLACSMFMLNLVFAAHTDNLMIKIAKSDTFKLWKSKKYVI